MSNGLYIWLYTCHAWPNLTLHEVLHTYVGCPLTPKICFFPFHVLPEERSGFWTKVSHVVAHLA